MVFSSPIFVLFFLPLVLGVSVLLKKSALNPFLLLASLVFYDWGGAGHLTLLFTLVLINWVAGIIIEKYEDLERYRTKDFVYFLCIAINVGGLFYYKYINFFIDNINIILQWFGTSLPHHAALELPLGISFFTFHLISYVVDIHRGIAKAQRSPIDFGLYICFFPQIIAGPIIRYHDVEEQLTSRTVTVEKFASGVERFIIGLAKKVLLANPLGQTVDRIFALPDMNLSTPVAWLGICGYALQLYFDFSGYSDMAIGLARMFGFEYLENFNYPFVSKSIHEFWQRWHISLSNWFRDYFYMPLVVAIAHRRARAGVRKKFDDRLPLAIVFFVCGIWHGASWNFAMFGMLHGLFLVLERGRLGGWLKKAPAILSRLYVYLVIIVAWVFFRCETFSGALHYLKIMFTIRTSTVWPLAAFLDMRTLLLLPIALIGCSPLFSCVTRDWRARASQAFGLLGKDETDDTEKRPRLDSYMLWIRIPVLASCLILSLVYIAGNTYNPFLYFRF